LASTIALLATALSTAAAIVAVYAPGIPLRGSVWMAALAGGAALAFTRPFLLVLAPYLAVLLDGRASELRGPVLYLGGFALAFIVTIGGMPRPIATTIYGAERLVDVVGGLIFLLLGVLAVIRAWRFEASRPRGAKGRAILLWTFAAALGLTTGALMYHELDPTYDSVFFATANAEPASHAPLTVALFTAALGGVYLVAGGAARALIAKARGGDAILRAVQVVAGLATAALGLALLTDRFPTVRWLLL